MTKTHAELDLSGGVAEVFLCMMDKDEGLETINIGMGELNVFRTLTEKVRVVVGHESETL